MNLDNIEELPILDKAAAIERLGDESLFETMMEGFEDMTMGKNLTTLKIAVDELDYLSIRMQAHSLKGASSYLGAERVKKAAEKCNSILTIKRLKIFSKTMQFLFNNALY